MHQLQPFCGCTRDREAEAWVLASNWRLEYNHGAKEDEQVILSQELVQEMEAGQ
jgi:hypothetical protein